MIKDPELLKLAVKAIEAEPESWNQCYWVFIPDIRITTFAEYEKPISAEVCGTTMCLAGHIVNQAGYQILGNGYECQDPNSGQKFMIESKAGDLVGLDNDEMALLFRWRDGLQDLPPTVAELKERIIMVTGVDFE